MNGFVVSMFAGAGGARGRAVFFGFSHAVRSSSGDAMEGSVFILPTACRVFSECKISIILQNDALRC